MNKAVLSLALGLSLVAFGAGNLQAAPPNPFCFDFSAFCDCATVSIVLDSAGGTTKRFVSTWQNQDCAGTTSQLGGHSADLRNGMAGELNTILGVDGCNFNFTWVGSNGAGSSGVFDLDSPCFGKVQDDTPYSIVAGACPADCSAAAKPSGQPSSAGR